MNSRRSLRQAVSVMFLTLTFLPMLLQNSCKARPNEASSEAKGQPVRIHKDIPKFKTEFYRLLANFNWPKSPGPLSVHDHPKGRKDRFGRQVTFTEKNIKRWVSENQGKFHRAFKKKLTDVQLYFRNTDNHFTLRCQPQAEGFYERIERINITIPASTAVDPYNNEPLTTEHPPLALKRLSQDGQNHLTFNFDGLHIANRRAALRYKGKDRETFLVYVDLKKEVVNGRQLIHPYMLVDWAKRTNSPQIICIDIDFDPKAYANSGTKPPTTEKIPRRSSITYNIDVNWSDGKFTGDEIVRLSLKVWNQDCRIPIEAESNIGANTIFIMQALENQEPTKITQENFHGKRRVVVTFNSKFPWTAAGLQAAAMHAIGRSIGLSYSDDPNSIMFKDFMKTGVTSPRLTDCSR